MRGWIATSVLLLSCVATSAKDEGSQERWLWLSGNLLVPEETARAIQWIERASELGFSTIALSDFKFGFPDLLPAVYRLQIRKVVSAARRHGVEIVPVVAPLGDARPLLTRDANLAAGVPARKVPFIVKDQVAFPDPQSSSRLINGSFEEDGKPGLTGWTVLDPHSVRRVATEEGHAIELIGSETMARVSQRFPVAAWRPYRLSLRLRTSGVVRPQGVRVLVFVQGSHVLYHVPKVQASQPWTRYHLIFTSLEGGEARVVIGTWNVGGGRAWLDDVSLSPAGLDLIIRREDAPLLVTRRDGRELLEGRDFEPVRNPLSAVLRRGDPPTAAPESPALRLRPEAGVHNGEVLQVSYHHTLIFGYHGVPISLCTAGFERPIRVQMRWIAALFAPRRVLTQPSEVRLIGYEDACRGQGTAADIFRKALKVLFQSAKRDGNVDEVAIWSDMVDPHHNARDPYYLTRGGMKQSWTDLPSDTLIINWNPTRPRESQRFFEERGLAQIVSVDEGLPVEEQARVIAAGRGMPATAGYMYTTWRRRYEMIPAFLRAVTAHEPVERESSEATVAPEHH